MPLFHHRFSSAFLIALLLLISLGHGLLAVIAMREKSTTSDELGHVTGGYTFNHWNDYRMHPENGLLPQRWQTLPTTIAGVHHPDLSGEDWRQANVWMLGYRFFHQSGNNHEWMLFTARAMNAAFGVATILLVGLWARYFFGWAGTFTAAFFGALCPTMLAHSALATSDMAIAFFLLASVSTFWWHLHDARRRIFALSLATFALACVAKFTAVLLPLIFVVMALLRCAHVTPLKLAGREFRGPAARLTATAVSILGHGLVSVFVIWAFCGFRYSAFNPALPPGEFTLSWDYVLSFGGWKAQVVNFCREWRLLPESFLYGFMFVLKHVQARGAFLDGDYSIFGWISFFPKAFLYKTPPSLLVALAGAATLLLVWARKKGMACIRDQAYRAVPLLLLFGVYWGFSLTSHLNIGHRHILPTYPVLYILTGMLGLAVVRAWQYARVGGWVAGMLGLLLGAWHLAAAWRIHPHYLAYFSPVAGGPANGYKHLVDSSLDWGQDLPGLKDWLDAHRRVGEPVFLSYFGTSEPDYYGIEAVRMPMIHKFDRARPWYWLEPGIYAISATMLQHVYMSDRGPWTLENERQYQELRANDDAFRALKEAPHGHPELLQAVPPEQWARAWNRYEELRFARLCHYLRVRRPDAMIGYSILIFRLSQGDIDLAVNSRYSDWLAAMAAVRR